MSSAEASWRRDSLPGVTTALRPAHPFAYAAPRSLEEALALLQRWGPGARLLAGGTDLLIAMRERGLRPECLVALKRIPGLAEIDVTPEGGLRLGALVTVRALEQSPAVHERFPVLAEAAHLLGSVQVRNLATLGGNLCNASPCADLAPPLLVLDATVELTGTAGRRRVPLSEFFTGAGRTVLNGDILTAVCVPPPAPGARAAYLKHGPRRAMDIAAPGVAVLVSLDAAAGRCADIRIALGGVAATPLRAAQAEAMLRGQEATPQRIQAAAALAAEESRRGGRAGGLESAGRPGGESGRRTSREYRRAMIAVLTRRALESVCR